MNCPGLHANGVNILIQSQSVVDYSLWKGASVLLRNAPKDEKCKSEIANDLDLVYGKQAAVLEKERDLCHDLSSIIDQDHSI
jgi:hypothetical protein